MREIKFRGRYIFEGNVLYPDRIDEWKYGSLIIDGDEYRIKVGASSFLVAKETVGQLTEFEDKNKKEIYEGDIIDKKYKGIVVFMDGCFYVDHLHLSGRRCELLHIWLGKRYVARCPSAIIGNITETPELLKVAT